MPGLDSTKTSGRWKPAEIVNQIRITREQLGASGHIHWNMKSLMRNSAFDETLEREVYRQPALAPAAPWLGGGRPGKPKLQVGNNEAGSHPNLRWTPVGSDKVWLWLVQSRTRGEWATEILPGAQTAAGCEGADVIAVSAVDRNGNVSAATVLSLRRR
jgi:hypothetical protein